ncbi:hypothetical protein ELY33_16505 [Vreelandella andesensis]|uniref:Uncharacterized protein n=1 Tax=Vreelandella andesensis TaxID=447567 RepID=A0A433KEY3_9GAMM|nr:hypothetical protein [Halomonas andesensis]RUR26711.1 hypothetical protein ELY33_16505 [Halomonas andesensis]
MLIQTTFKKVSVLGALMAILASPVATAQTSIELNQDKDVIVKAISASNVNEVKYTRSDFVYDKGDRQSDNDYLNEEDSNIRMIDDYARKDLMREGGRNNS